MTPRARREVLAGEEVLAGGGVGDGSEGTDRPDRGETGTPVAHRVSHAPEAFRVLGPEHPRTQQRLRRPRGVGEMIDGAHGWMLRVVPRL